MIPERRTPAAAAGTAGRSVLLLLPALLLVSGCAYFNTFYNARNYYREGVRLSEQKQVGQARDRFEKAIEKSALVLSRWPKSRWADNATFLIGQSYYEMGQYGRAIRHFDQLVLAFPESRFVPRARYYRGLAMLRDREYGPARVLLEQVRRDYPELGDGAAYHLAASFFEREEWARAADSLAAFIEQFPKSKHRPDAERRLALSCEKLGRWQECERAYRRLAGLVAEPRARVEVRLRIASALVAQGRHDEAVPVIRELLGRFPEFDDEAYILLGRSLAETGRTDEALETWRRVRGSNELGAEAMFRIGRFHEELGEYELARAHYDSSRSRRATSEYGMTAAKRLALLDAIARTDSAGGRDPAEALFLIAEVQNLNLEDYEEARLLYAAVADSHPDTEWAPKALLARAWITYYVEDDSAGARPELQRIIARYPETEYAYEAKRWLGLPAPPRKKPEPAAPEPPVPPEPPPAKPPARPVEPDRPPPDLPPELPPDEPGDWPEPDLEPEPGPTEPPEQAAPDPARPGRTPPFAEPARPPEKPAGPKPGETQPEPPAAAGDTSLAPVRFEFDRADIRAADAEALGRLAGWLRDNPARRLRLTGYCDPRGSDEYNLELGLRRARAVAEFLTGAGIEPGRLETETRGRAGRLSRGPGDFRLDRRVEFELL